MFTRIFEHISSARLLMLSILVLFAQILISNVLQVRFDGVIDLHAVKDLGWKAVGLDMVASWGVLWAGLLWLGKRIQPRVRAVDVFNAIGIARIPLVLLALVQSVPQVAIYQEELLAVFEKGQLNLPTHLLLFVSVLAILSLGATILFVILLFRGYKVATNFKTNRHIAWFFVTLLLSEIVAKAWLFLFY
jgi:hypothetical protein